MNSCDACTLCCKLLEVKALHKPAGVWCEHAVNAGRSRGCAIYAQRPEPCRTFACLWLAHDFPDELKPDRTHVVLTQNDDGIQAIVDPNYHDAAVKGPMGHFLSRLVAAGIPVFMMEGHHGRLRVRSADLTEAHTSSP